MSKAARPGGTLGLLRIETRRGAALLLSPLILAAAYWMSWNGLYGVMSEATFTNVFHEVPPIAAQQTLLFGGLIVVALASVVLGAGGSRVGRAALAVSLSVTAAGVAPALASGNPYSYDPKEPEVVAGEVE